MQPGINQRLVQRVVEQRARAAADRLRADIKAVSSLERAGELLVMAEAFGAQPEAPINQASADWQDTKAAYAFFANPNALSAEILLPHQQRTLERMAAYPLVLAVQDTSFLNYISRSSASLPGGCSG
jgi:Transposase DNA-binding